jgi:putative SOS response-associated peptidase YedK
LGPAKRYVCRGAVHGFQNGGGTDATFLAIVAPDGQPEARRLRWGLVPWWSRDLKSAAKMINARVETVASKPADRDLLLKASRRALQVAAGYFEWLAWLDPSLDVPDLLDLCQALPASRLSARPANPAVNKLGGPEDPELLAAA